MIGIANRVVLLTAVALLLGACGVRGPLQNPKPEANSAPPPQDTASAESGQNKPENAAPKRHQGFILDGLIR
jgi:predicted small lipoprotein YifL